MATSAKAAGTGTQVIGKAFIVYGTAKAVAPDGTVRVLGPNSVIYADERIITESDGGVSIMLDGPPPSQIDIGRMSDVLMNEDVYAGATPEAVTDASADAEKIQEALLEGDQPIELEATAAGGGAGTGGMDVVRFALDGSEGNVTSGAETTGYTQGTVDTFDAVAADDTPAILETSNVTVDETGGLKTVTGTLSFEFGGDGPGAIVLSAAGATWDTGTLTLTANDDTWQVVVNDDGTYTFTQLAPIDHPDIDNPDDAIPINITAMVTDVDGDTATGTFTIDVYDDGPSISIISEQEGGDLHVSEGGWCSGKVDFGQLESNYGTDGAGTVALLATGATWNAENFTLLAEDGAWKMVLNPETGDYTFYLLKGLDHSDSDGPIHITVEATVTDADGDSANVPIDIQVDDAGPHVVFTDPWLPLFNATVDETGGFDTVYGNFVADFGMDGADVDRDGTGPDIANPIVLSATFLNQAAVWNGNTNTLTWTAAGDTSPSWTLTVGDHGFYAFEQLQAIDHPIINNPDDPLYLNIKATVTDSDGSTAVDWATIRIDDDGPTVYKASSAFVDDEGLGGGIPGGAGDIVVPDTDFDGSEATFSGKLNFSFGADKEGGNIDFASMTSGKVGTENVDYSWNSATHTLTATVDSDDVARNGINLFKVEVTDQETGAYKVTLLDNVLHDAPPPITINTGNTNLSNGIGANGMVKITADASGWEDLNTNDGAFGITSKYDGEADRFDEINYLGNGKYEIMTFELLQGKVAHSATVDITEFYSPETGVGNEVGAYTLYLGNNMVQDWTPFTAKSSGGDFQLVINSSAAFDEIRFKAIQGTNDPSGGDSSDYNVKQVTFDQSYENDATANLTYTVTDGDGDHVHGTLKITFDDDMPAAVHSEISLQVPEVAISNFAAGWVAPFDGNVGIQTDHDSDSYPDEIQWGTNAGRSGYEFTDNEDLRTSGGVEIDSTFALGTFVHNNFPIAIGSDIKGADLKVTFNVVIDDHDTPIEHTIHFAHNETTNISGNPDASADIVTITPSSTDNFEVDGQTYHVDILGFQNVDGTGEIFTSINTLEGQANEFTLLARLSTDDPPSQTGTLDPHWGADGPAAVNSLTWVAGVIDGDTTTIDGDQGTLVVNNATGVYTYTLDGAQEPLQDTFTYSLQDADGDIVDSTLTFNINALMPPPEET